MDKLMTHHDYLKRVMALIGVGEQSIVPLADARGMALADDVRADIDTPPFNNSSLDGFAVRVEDVASVPVTLPIAAEIPAGANPTKSLTQGTTHRIMTGAPLPQAATAVIPVEWTESVEGGVRIIRAAPVGHGIRNAGSDVARGTAFGKRGQLVSAGLVGLASSLGFENLPTFSRPRVTIISTGDELVRPGTALTFGKIYDANLELMAALTSTCGALIVGAHRLSDDVPAAIDILEQAASESDLVVTSGGISAGDFEVIKQAGVRLGGFEFSQVALQPGKPQGYGAVDATPVIALPGNPVSTYVSYLMFAYPALRKLGGHDRFMLPQTRAKVTATLQPSPDRVRLLPSYVNLESGFIETPSAHSSHLLSTIAKSNALVEVPVGNAPVEPGSELTVLLTPGF